MSPMKRISHKASFLDDEASEDDAETKMDQDGEEEEAPGTSDEEFIDDDTEDEAVEQTSARKRLLKKNKIKLANIKKAMKKKKAAAISDDSDDNEERSGDESDDEAKILRQQREKFLKAPSMQRIEEQLLQQSKKRKQNKETIPAKRSKMSEDELQQWNMLTTNMLERMPRGEPLHLDDLYFWRSYRMLHKGLWKKMHPEKALPSQTEWNAENEDGIDQKLWATAFVDEDLDRKKADVTIKAKALVKDKKMVARMTDLAAWVKKRRLHKEMTRLLHSKSPPEKNWIAVENEIVQLLVQEHEAQRNVIRHVIDQVTDQLNHEADTAANPAPIIDFSEPRTPKTIKNGSTIIIGEGFAIVHGMISFSTAGQHGTYEGVSIVKTITKDEGEKNKNTQKDLSITMPIRNISSLYKAVKAMRSAIDEMEPLPTSEELKKELLESGNGTVDVTSRTDQLPNITYKLDEFLIFAAEKSRWGKAMVECVTFTRLPKEKNKKGFTLQIPAKCFTALELAVNHIHDVNGNFTVVE